MLKLRTIKRKVAYLLLLEETTIFENIAPLLAMKKIAQLEAKP